MTVKRKLIGKWGEEFAAKEFVKKGFSLLETNWQNEFGEIDIIVAKEKEIVFVEVKTRSSNCYGWAEEAVNKTKKQKIKKTINQFLIENDVFVNYFPRFDIMVIEIQNLNPNIIHYENVEL